MVLSIVKIGHPVLRRICPLVKKGSLRSPGLHQLIGRMVATMRKADGVGLAANQVAAPIKLVVLECASNRRYPGRDDFPLEVLINPRILKYSKDTVRDWEGCLSIPGYRGIVARSRQVTYSAITPEGKKIMRTVSGFCARVIQHEVDHVNGLVYMDRMKDLRHWVHLDNLEPKSVRLVEQ
ncbi:MAG: peptide deformylase [Omnitrophica bacterium RIFCSPHIGHO2_02_FULL_63_14]|nr:MAG: peptide deformylase [Omnitrophica bacterium RIFCSPHIGHO2_02_FULL_63_14]